MFEAAISKFENAENELEAYLARYNPSRSGWGSHVRLLAAAALATTGDILELGECGSRRCQKSLLR